MLEKRDFSQSERRAMAARGHALPDGSFPIENEKDLHNAAILARSGHGQVRAAKKLIARRAKELGVPNPLKDAAELDARHAEAVGEAVAAKAALGPQDPYNPYLFADPNAVAVRHGDLQQQPALSAQDSTTLEPCVPDAFEKGNFVRDVPNVTVQHLDLRTPGMRGGNPLAAPGLSPLRPESDIARDGKANGTHSLESPECTPRNSMKASSPLELMKMTQQRMR